MTHDPREALEPCPFCGGNNVILSHKWDYGFIRRYPYCNGCGARGPSFNGEEESRAWWNTRALTASPGEQEPVVEGYVLVPVEPTPEIIRAMHHKIDWCRDDQNTYEVEHPSQNPNGVGTTCKQDICDAYRAMIEALRREAPASAGVALADWSDLPKDIYVTSAKRVNAVGYDVQCCSVPMVTAPEVRYVRADMIAAVNASVEARCKCGPVCEGLEAGNCRYYDVPYSRKVLRRLVDLTWNHVTESTTVPSFDTADTLIDKALSAVGDEATKSEVTMPPFGGYGSAEAAVKAADANARTCKGFASALKCIRDGESNAPQIALDALRMPSSGLPSDPTAERREIVARIINPAAFNSPRSDPGISVAREKADAILAAIDGGAGA